MFLRHLTRYFAALALLTVAVGIRVAVDPWLGDSLSYPTVYLAVLLSTWHFGIGPAVLNTAAGYVLIQYLVRDKPFTDSGTGYWVASLALYLGLNAAIIFFITRFRRERDALGRAQARLEDAERHMERLVESLPQLIWTCTADCECDYVNRQWRDYTGRSEKSQRWLSQVHDGDKARVSSAWESAVKDGTTFRSELRIRRHDGQFRWFSAVGVPQLEGGRGGKWFGSNTDIEDRKRAEDALRESEQRFRGSFDNAALGMLICDTQTRIMAANRQAHKILGYEDPELIGMTIDDLTDPADRAASRVMNEKYHHGVMENLNYEKRYLKRDGTPLWVHITVSAIRDADGRHVRSIGTFDDISARKAAEERIAELNKDLERQNAELGAERERWKRVVQGIADEVWIADQDGRMSVVNLPAVTHMGLEEFKNKTVHEVLDEVEILNPDGRPRPPQDAPLLRALKGEIVRGEERMVHRASGRSRWRQYSSAPIRDAANNTVGSVAVVRDITEEKQTQEALRESEQHYRAAKFEAEQASAAKDQFLAVLSHELRTPLTPVLAALTLLERQEPLSVELRENLEIIRRNVTLEAQLIDDLLDLTRIARGKITLERKHVNVADILNRVIEVCRPDLEARKQRLDIDLSREPAAVNGDPSRLQQVFWNLLKNAIKFTPEGGRIALSMFAEDREAIVEVRDNGIGIDPEVLPRLFGAFEQGDQSITRLFGGLGLGLAISKRLIDMHDGAITVYSEGRGHGALFRVTLPLLGAADVTQAEKISISADTAPQRILVVEDNRDTLHLLRTLLVRSGHQVAAAADVAQALRIVALQEFDLLISDLGLPDRSGLELMQELRKAGNHLKGIALTGYAREDDIRRSKEAGFMEHLAKPIDFEMLKKAIKRVVEE